MQPHSMCTLALANYAWNSINPRLPEACSARIEYKDKNGLYKSNGYKLYGIRLNSDNTELTVSIVRDGGGLSCTMHARRSSTSEGSSVTMTHETQHVSGLREIFNLYKSGIKSGRHENSQKYGDFNGDIRPHNYKDLRLECKIKKDNGSMATSSYGLTLYGL